MARAADARCVQRQEDMMRAPLNPHGGLRPVTDPKHAPLARTYAAAMEPWPLRKATLRRHAHRQGHLCCPDSKWTSALVSSVFALNGVEISAMQLLENGDKPPPAIRLKDALCAAGEELRVVPHGAPAIHDAAWGRRLHLIDLLEFPRHSRGGFP